MFDQLLHLWRSAGSPPIPAEALDLILDDDDGADVPPDVPRRYWRKFRGLLRHGQGSTPGRADERVQRALAAAVEGDEIPPNAPPWVKRKFLAMFRPGSSPPAPDALFAEAQALAEAQRQLAAALAKAEAAETLAREREKAGNRAAEEARKAALATAAADFARRMIEDLCVAVPAERNDLTEHFRLCSEVDRHLATLGVGTGTSMVARFERLLSHRPPHRLFQEQIAAADGMVLPPVEPGRPLSQRPRDPDAPPSVERKKELLSLIPSGRAAIENGLLKRH